MSKKGLTLLAVVVGAAAAAVYWPAKVEEYFPGWVQRTAAIRTFLPGAEANLPKTAANAQGARPGGAGAPQRPSVPVAVDTVLRGPMPLRVDTVGTVQPIQSVPLKTRADAAIDKVMVPDGALVQAGDVLVKLDSRQIEAQVKQTEANIAKDNALIEQTQRDVNRYLELFGKGAGTQLNYDNAKSALKSAQAQLAADQAQLENQKVQMTWYTLTAPITGRLSKFNAKIGTIVRGADNTATGVLATIVQTKPIYVTFSVPQVVLAPIREAVDRGEGMVVATPQGGERNATGKIAVLGNTIDASTGTITIDAVFDNADEVLWPGQLCNVRVTLKTEPDVVSIPRTATQSGQIGNYVYAVENGVAKLRRVKVGRFQDGRDVILEGLNGGETVVSDGALLLTDGSRVDIRNKDTAKKDGA